MARESTHDHHDENDQREKFFHSFHYFSVNNVHFYADTLSGDCNVKLTMAIRKTAEETDDAFSRQKIRSVKIFTNYDLNSNKDTTGQDIIKVELIIFLVFQMIILLILEMN